MSKYNNNLLLKNSTTQSNPLIKIVEKLEDRIDILLRTITTLNDVIAEKEK